MIYYTWWAPQINVSWNPGDENNIPYPVTYIDNFFQEIIIRLNSLKHIDPLAFEGLPKLRHIYILLHSLHQAPDLNAIGGTLESFRLSNCRCACENINLNSLINLKSLVVDKSNLRVVPRDVKLIALSLESLVLSKNMISNLSNMYNIPFPKLRIVILNFNNISHLNHGFLQFPVLQIFAIKHNKLSHLADMSSCVWGVGHDESVSFVALDVASNPWHCNGSMEWIKTSICHRRIGGILYYKRLILAIALDHLFCYSPAELQGVAVVPVDDLDVNGMETCGEFYNDLHTDTITIYRRYFNALRPKRNRRQFVEDIFKRIFLNESVFIWIKIPFKFIHKVQINGIPTLFQVMTWRRSGDKPVFETMMVILLTPIFPIRPQWVNSNPTKPEKGLPNPTQNAGHMYYDVKLCYFWTNWLYITNQTSNT